MLTKFRPFTTLATESIVLTLSFINSSTAVAGGTYLDFNSGSGHTFSGWTWIDRGVVNPRLPSNGTGANAYGAQGWTGDSGALIPGTGYWSPRTFLKDDIVDGNPSRNTGDAIIDTNERAPSTATGGSLKVYDTGASTIYHSRWWFQRGYNWGSSGFATATDNRLEFYVKLDGPDFATPAATTMHFGTYLCWPGGGLGGQNCPTEAANRHYYHVMDLNPGAWIHVQLDPHPSHQRNMGSQGGGPEPASNPEWPSHPYFSSLNDFYYEIRYAQPNPTAYWIDEIRLWEQTQPENDLSIASPWIGYWPGTGKWEIGFYDLSYTSGVPWGALGPTSQSSFEIRWSTAPITNENWNSATPITPEMYRRGLTNSFYRANTWTYRAWTRFTLPTGTETANNKIHFAIKDVSTIANGDGHNSPNTNVRTIDYTLRAGTERTFLDFNEPGASGTSWPGWTWCDGSVDGCVSYSSPGWFLTDYVFANNTKLPRCFRKSDYSNYSIASLDATMRAPSTSTGASLKITDTGTGTTYQPSWWIWDADNNLESKGIATPAHDRMSSYIYLQGQSSITNPNTDGYTFEWGTYTCWPEGQTYDTSHPDCPNESDNGHWYHQVTMATGMWVHMLWDKHPTHRRNVGGYPPNNPTMVESGRDYFANMSKQYMQFQRSIATPASSAFWIDELKFLSSADLGEPNQNDTSITSLWIGFQPTDKHWEIGWNDLSSSANHDSEYEIRWSTQPITNANWTSATVVTPMDFVLNGNHVHKSNTWKFMLWTRFLLPTGTETNNDRLYFGVKDVSVAGGLYQNSPSPLIHTIDYTLRSGVTSADSTAPQVSSFALPATATALTVPVSVFTATDNVAVTGYLITESATAPSLSNPNWSPASPTLFTFSSQGSRTAYAWAKDAAGNLSPSAVAAVTITLLDTTAPSVTAFSMPLNASSLTVPVTSLAATDAVGVVGYMITESPAPPSPSATLWSFTAPTVFTFSGAGTRTAYAWAKDTAGNVSASMSKNVTITLSDTTAPSVSISSPASQATLKGTVNISASATDNVGVIKVDFFSDGTFIGSDSSSPYSIIWNTTSHSSGTHSLTARAYDAAGNMTTSAAVPITIRRLPRAPLLTRVR